MSAVEVWAELRARGVKITARPGEGEWLRRGSATPGPPRLLSPAG